MLFGYNVFIGLKPETAVDDVFSLHRFARVRADDGADDRPAGGADGTRPAAPTVSFDAAGPY